MTCTPHTGLTWTAPWHTDSPARLVSAADLCMGFLVMLWFYITSEITFFPEGSTIMLQTFLHFCRFLVHCPKDGSQFPKEQKNIAKTLLMFHFLSFDCLPMFFFRSSYPWSRHSKLNVADKWITHRPKRFQYTKTRWRAFPGKSSSG